MRGKYFEITITGKGTFPVDMLRYSCCWPVHPQDVANIDMDYNDRATFRDSREVTVGMLGSMGSAINCVDRFASFGWHGRVTKEESVSY